MGKLLEEPVWLVTEVAFRPLTGRSVDGQTGGDLASLFLSGFYYCENRNLAQRLSGAHSTDDDFVGNGVLKAAAVAKGFPPEWLISAIFGHVAISEVDVLWDTMVKIVLINRTSIKRYGVRYAARGASSDGYPANTVESEQIIAVGNKIATHVQLRGSVPLVWMEEKGKLPVLHPNKATSQSAFSLHRQWLLARYNQSQSVHHVNLLSANREEMALSKEYETQCTDHNAPWTHFPYHSHINSTANLSESHWSRVVVNNIKVGLSAGFSVLEFRDGCVLVIRHQSIVLRTNCLDCVDRTSKVQTAFGYAQLVSMLAECLGFAHPLLPEDVVLLAKQLLHLWGAAADSISLHYSGSKSLQNYLIKDGSFKFTGLLQDKAKSAWRSYQHVFMDPAKGRGLRAVFGSVDETDRLIWRGVVPSGLPSPSKSSDDSDGDSSSRPSSVRSSADRTTSSRSCSPSTRTRADTVALDCSEKSGESS